MSIQSQLNQGATYADATAAVTIAKGNTQQAVSAGAAAAGATVLAILGPAAAAGPIGLAIGGAVLAIQTLSGQISHLITGCGDACVQATQIVNQADVIVQQIASAYWQTPIRTRSFQAWTLQQLDAIFNQVRSLCGKIPGDPGKRCVQERLTRGFIPPWCSSNNLAVGVNNVVSPNPTNILGRCGGWYDVTYDPIANDPGVQSDLAAPVEAVSATVTAIAAKTPGGYGTLMVIAAAVFALVAFKLRE